MPEILTKFKAKPWIKQTRVIFAALLVGSGPALAFNHSMDRYSDSKYWQQRPVNAGCPGPHFKSIWFKDHGTMVARICVETDSVMHLGNGDARARFVTVSYIYGNNVSHTSYISTYKAVNCDSGLWNSDRGYHVQNESSSAYLPVEGRPGWYEFTWNGKIPKDLNSLSTKFGIQLTRVTPQDRFLCPGL